MNGGSLDCGVGRLESLADAIEGRTQRPPLQLALSAHLRLVAEAIRSLAHVDSGDRPPGDADAALRAVVPLSAEAACVTAALRAAIAEAQALMGRMEAAAP